MAVAVAFSHCQAPCGRTPECNPEPRFRERFGCDEDTLAEDEKTGYSTHCWICYKKPVKGCPVCDGTRSIYMARCPNRCSTPGVRSLFRAYNHYKSGFLPSSGSMLDQSHTFTEAISLMDTLYGIHEDIQMKKAKAGK